MVFYELIIRIMKIMRAYREHLAKHDTPCSYGSFYQRITMFWWDIERAINTNNCWWGGNRRWSDIKDKYRELAFEWGVKYGQFRNNIKKWWSPKEAIKRTRKL